MSTAFQANAFQLNAFQIDEDALDAPPPAARQNRNSGSSTINLSLPRGQGLRAPRVPRVPKEPGIRAVVPEPIAKQATDPEEERQARWENYRTTVRHVSYPEFICFEWLEKVKNQTEGVDFVYLFPVLGGRTRFGGFEVDFYFPAKRLAWLVQGLEFHFVDPQDRARDKLAKSVIEARGNHVIELFEDDVIQRTAITLDAAWEGRQLKGRV